MYFLRSTKKGQDNLHTGEKKLVMLVKVTKLWGVINFHRK